MALALTSSPGEAAPVKPLACEPAEWYARGRAPTGCGPNGPVVSIDLASSSAARCAPKTGTKRAPKSGGFQATGTYACRSEALAHNGPGTPTFGSVTPRYYVAAIVYSPPGCTVTPAGAAAPRFRKGLSLP